MGKYNNYGISAPTDRTITEDSCPDLIENMSAETFNTMTYKEQLVIKRKWPSVYVRLTAQQERK